MKFGACAIAVAVLLALLAGCNQEPEWRMAPQIYDCTDEQMQRVEKQAEWCTKNTGYFSTSCLGHALIRNCKLNEERAARLAPWLLKDQK